MSFTPAEQYEKLSPSKEAKPVVFRQTKIEDGLKLLKPREKVAYDPNWPVIVWFDTETTGLDCGQDRIASLAAKVDTHQRVKASEPSFEILINPGVEMPAEASKINGLTTEHLQSAPSSREALWAFIQWCERLHKETQRSVVLVAHCGFMFDGPILAVELRRYGIQFPDWLLLSDSRDAYRFVLPTGTSARLQDLIRRYIQPHSKKDGLIEQAHEAMWDVVMLELVCSQLPCTNAIYTWLIQHAIPLYETKIPKPFKKRS